MKKWEIIEKCWKELSSDLPIDIDFARNYILDLCDEIKRLEKQRFVADTLNIKPGDVLAIRINDDNNISKFEYEGLLRTLEDTFPDNRIIIIIGSKIQLAVLGNAE